MGVLVRLRPSRNSTQFCDLTDFRRSLLSPYQEPSTVKFCPTLKSLDQSLTYHPVSSATIVQYQARDRFSDPSPVNYVWKA